MDRDLINRIADAVLYEGYLLYPYRPSAMKNRQRWTFGGLFPQSSDLARTGSEPSGFRCECLLETTPETTLTVRVRFLHLIETAGWQEAEPREVEVRAVNISAVTHAGTVHHDFAFPAMHETNGHGPRDQKAIAGRVRWSAVPVEPGLVKVTLCVENVTQLPGADGGREDVLPFAFASTHAVLETAGGAFVSQLDPPAGWREHADKCANVGVFPVLVGAEGDRSAMLASPIILYEYPQVAPESPGDFFDGTEIDEMLTLRVLTMTDAEKAEMRAGDPRGRDLLARTEATARDQLMRLHGKVRTQKPGESP
jgi:hydrogenase maturation protease